MLVVGFCSLETVQGHAYPPDGMKTKWVQPDGTVLRLRVFGNHYYARTTTEDGYTVILNADDHTYYYATPGPKGKRLVSSDVAAHRPPPKMLTPHLKEDPQKVEAIRSKNMGQHDTDLDERWEAQTRAVRQRREREAAGLAPLKSGKGTITGSRKGLMILVQFPDDPETKDVVDPVNFPADRAKMDRYCNAANYTEDGNTGSIRDYFRDQSGGKFDLSHVVTEVLTMPKARNYYNFSDYPTNKQLRKGSQGLLLGDALKKLKDTGFDFSGLTMDGNNNIRGISLLFAGEDSGKWLQGLWPVAGHLSERIQLGTEQNPRYAFNYQATNMKEAPVIGTACHELTHLWLSVRDYYDTDRKDGDSAGIGSHGLMGGGNYNNGQKTPAPISLYLKDRFGWATIEEVPPTGGALVKSLPATGNRGIRIRKPGSDDEYFLIENRGAPDKWAAGCQDEGILIWHVDEAVTTRNQRQQRTATHHYELSLEQADGLFELEKDKSAKTQPGNEGDANDLFDSDTPHFDDNTSPNAKWWDGGNSGVSIEVQSSAGPSMNVLFGAGRPSVTLAVANPEAEWKSGAHAISLPVRSNTTWTWSSNAEWLTIPDEAASQTGNQTLVYHVELNTSQNPRVGSLTFTGGGLTRTHTVTQAGRDDHGDVRSLATVVGPNSTIAGVFDTAGDSEYFRIEVTAAGTLNVSTTGSNDTRGILFDGAGSQLADYGVRSGESGGNMRIGYGVSPGTYFVQVKHADPEGTGAYQFVSSFATDPIVTLTPPTREVPAAGGTFSFAVATEIVWTHNTPTAASWVGSGDPTSRTGNQTIGYFVDPNPTTNRRTAVVTVMGGGASTTHTIVQAGMTPDDHGDDPATATVVEANSTTGGNVQVGGDNDVYRVNVSEPGTLIVQTTGALDTFGTLLDDGGSELTTNDDAGEGGNFRISRVVSPGTYYVRVRHSSPRETGVYELVTSLTPEPALTVNPTRRSAEGDGGAFDFAVNANTTWSWISSAPWVTSSDAASQDGNQAFSYAVAANDTPRERTAVITLSAGVQLIGYWPFDNANGPGAAHPQAVAPDAVLNGDASHIADGRIGGALDFGAFNDGSHAQVPAGAHFDSINGQDSFAVSFWLFNRNTNTPTSSFWVNAPASDGEERGIQAHVPWNDGNIYFDQSGCCDAPERIRVRSNIAQGQWQHVVFQKEDGLRQMWVNGVKIAEAAGSDALDPLNGALIIGAASPNGGSINGMIDDFAIFDGALNPAQISVLSEGSPAISVIQEGLTATHTITQAALALPDLVDSGSYHAVSPTSVAPGGQINVGANAQNQGTAPSGAYVVRYYLSADAIITSSDYVLGEKAMGDLRPGASASIDQGALTVPAEIPEGTYFVGWIYDADLAVEESDEENNTGHVASQTVTVAAPSIGTVRHTLRDGSESQWFGGGQNAINEASLTTANGQSSDAFDGVGVLVLTPAITLPPLVSATGAGPFSSSGTSGTVMASREVSLVPGRHAADEVIVLTNNGASAQSVSLRIDDNYGSDDDTQVHGTSSGDKVVTAADSWFVSNDKEASDAISGDPTLMVSWKFSDNLPVPTLPVVPGEGIGAFRIDFGSFSLGAGESVTVAIRRELFDSADLAILTGRPISVETVISQNLGDGSQSNWGDLYNQFHNHLHDANLTTPSGSSGDAFDGVGVLAAGPGLQSPPLTTPDRNGPLTSVGRVGAVTVTKSISVVSGRHATDEVITLTNSSSVAESFPFVITDNYGSDGATQVHGTSSGDLLVGRSDHWFVTSDQAIASMLSGDPSLMVSWSISENLSAPSLPEVPGVGSDVFKMDFGVITLNPEESATVTIRRELFDSAELALLNGVPLENLNPVETLLTSLGTGTGALLGRSEPDLTDPENDGVDLLGAENDLIENGWNFVGAVSNEKPFFQGREGALNIFDNKLGPGDDKWCCNARNITIEFEHGVSLTHFTLSSANDVPNRDPRVFRILGSVDGVNFDPIYENEGATRVWQRRLEVVRLDLPNPTPYYRYFRYEADSNWGDSLFQLGEWELFGTIDDRYEENDGPGTAFDLTARSGVSLTGIQADEDWYRIAATEGERVVIDCTFAHADGDIDIRLLDASLSQVDASQDTVDSEQIDLTVPATGDYYIVLEHGNAGNVYDLVWRLFKSDSDGDGMTDQYELENGLDPSDPSDALSDHDGDGFKAAFEYAMGTGATDFSSKPTWTITYVSPSRVDISYGPIIAGRTYSLKATTTGPTLPQINSYTASADAATHTYSDNPNGARRKIYQLEVLIP